jgi:hypothetical protein
MFQSSDGSRDSSPFIFRAALVRAAVFLAGIAAVAFIALAHGADKPTPPATWNGLELTQSKALDLLYKKPGVTFSTYRRIMLDPVEVDFRKNWTPDPRRVSSSDRERIRKELAEAARAVFKKELEEKGGYTFATESAPDVLRVTAALTDLYIAAPDTMSAGRSRSYAVSAGEVTLLAELRDSDSGDLLAVAADRGQARGNGYLQWTSGATNAAEARALLTGWAQLLRKGLDASKTL